MPPAVRICEKMRQPRLLISEAGERHPDAERDADRDSAQLADPAIVECVLQEERGGEENQHDRDPANPATPDQGFELEGVERWSLELTRGGGGGGGG